MPESFSSTQPANTCQGRFAPSPTGPLHFGSLVTALGSFLQARSQQGVWRVRIEDLDPPREVPGAADDILRTLEAFHLTWDGPVVYQSHRLDAYQQALDQLTRKGHTFACACTRKTILKANRDSSHDVYPGTCRNGLPPDSPARAQRLRVPAFCDAYTDQLQGEQLTRLDLEVGDFVVHRADGLFAYHLAVVVDDAYQQINEIVRGADLLSSTPPQRYLQTVLGYPHPTYIHLPIASNPRGEKLSKQTYARPVGDHPPGPVLRQALEFLGQNPDPVVDDTPSALLEWAIPHWQLAQVPRVHRIQVADSTNPGF